jgi:hypothetical protein
MRIIGNAWRWWQIRAQLREGRTWAERVLSHGSARSDSLGRAEALSAAGGLAYWSMDYVATRAAYTERLAVAEQLGDPKQLAEAHYDLGFLGMVDHDPGVVRREEQLALELFESIGDTPGAIRARQALTVAHFLTGDHATALALEEQNQAEFRRSGSWYRIADSLVLQAAIHRAAGHPDAAIAKAREGIRAMARHVGGATLGALAVIAVVHAESGDAVVAAHLAGAIRAIRVETGEALASVSVLHLPDPADAVSARLGEVDAEALMAEGATLTMDDAVALGLGLGDAGRPG